MGFFTKVKNLIMASTGAKIVAGAVVAVVLGGTGLVFANTVGSPENVLGAAVAKTFTKDIPAYEEVFGLTDLSEAMEDKGADISMDVTVKDIPLGSLGLGDVSLPSAGILVEVQQNAEGAASGTVTVKVADTPLASINSYADEKQLQVSVPDLFESVISFTYGDENLKEKMKASYLMDLLELADEDVEMLADSISGNTEAITEEEIEQELLKILTECYTAHLADTEVEKLDKEEVSVGEEELKCKAFEIRMDAQNVNAFIKDFTTRIVLYLQEIAIRNIESLVEEDYAALEEELAEFEPALQGEVVIKCLVAKGRLVDTIVNLTAATGEPCSLEVKLAPEGYAFGNMYCALQAPDDVFVEMEIKTENTKEKYITEWKMSAEEEPISMAFSYDKATGDFALASSLDGMSVEIAGIINELEKGSVIDATVETLCYSDGTTTMSQGVDASFRAAATEVEVLPLSGTQTDLLSMTEEDLMALSEEISGNITGMVFKLFGLLQ